MKLLILKDKKAVTEKVASVIISQIKTKPNSILGLATGKTMIPLYKELVNKHKKGKVDFSKVKTFNLDEYANSKAFHKYMNKHFFRKVNIKKQNIYFPKNSSYDNLIKKSGGIDLQVLGIGRNGHIGFNEPGSKIKSKTRKVKLSKQTKKANKIRYNYAYTMGISNILKAKKIILLATGKNKAYVIAKAIQGRITSKVPASFLKTHKNTTFLIDKSAGSEVKNN